MRTTRRTSTTRRRAAALAFPVILILAASAVRAADGPVGCYAETIVMRTDGSADVRIVVDVPAGVADPIVLPLASPDITSLATESALPAAVAVTMRGDRSVLLVTHAASAAVQSIAITFVRHAFLDMAAPPLAFGNRAVAYDFVNATGGAVAEFHVSIVLPPGFGITAIDRVVPAVSESTVTLPYEIGDAGGRVSITLNARDISIGAAQAMTVRVKPRASALPLAAGAVLASCWYLIRFRDRVRRDAKERRESHGPKQALQ